ncbi:unnamed protein product [Vicia faba]|uniref:Uncharacterized protein n=1 Tax=Vicia faba TaxID=3906 RepID=A0AAV1AT01_VICFA|nr:unnamed protein product [Vicia faba]
MMTKPQVHKENEDHVHEDADVDTSRANDGVVNNHEHAKTLGEDVNESYCTSNGNKYILISNDMTTQINESVDFIRLMDENSTFLNRYLNVETKDLPCANIKDHVVKMNDNIDNGVNAHEEYIFMNNRVHVEFVQSTKDTDPYIHMLKRNDLGRIDTERETPK